jgi:hypothetical protein
LVALGLKAWRLKEGKIRAWISCIVAIAALLVITGRATRAYAQVRFTNLDGRPVDFASYTYRPYRSSISAGEYNLPAVQEEGFRFTGWRIYPVSWAPRG